MLDSTSQRETAPPPAPPAKKVQGTIHVVVNRCKGCGFCIAFCPQKVLEFSEDYNSQGYHYPRLTSADGCTGCDLCGLYCPDFAIHGVMLKYGRNAGGRQEGGER
jgi:2-oxoglutarate ferredoxin oxidoreductase subunit delta